MEITSQKIYNDNKGVTAMQEIVCINKDSRSNNLYLLILGIAVYFLFSEHAHAAVGGGGALPYESWLTNLRDSATGPIAFSFGLIGIDVAGAILIFGGELNAFFRTFIFVVLVMALLVTANTVMTGLFGGAVVASNEVQMYYAAISMDQFLERSI